MGVLALGSLVLAMAVGIHGEVPAPRIDSECRFRGHPLKGRVRLVEAFPDVRVQIVTSVPDLRVQKVKALPDACGQWQIVDAFPDLRVQIVDAMPDLKIQLVEALPGRPITPMDPERRRP